MINLVRIAIPALLIGLGACQQRTLPAASGGFNAVAQQGPESWVIDGSSRQIDTTYYLALPEGLQFTIEVPVESVPETDNAAQVQAWPYIRYAYEQKIYLRTRVKRNGTDVQPSGIGVALVQHLGVRHHGYRVAMSITEIEARLHRGGSNP